MTIPTISIETEATALLKPVIVVMGISGIRILVTSRNRPINTAIRLGFRTIFFQLICRESWITMEPWVQKKILKGICAALA